MDRKYILAGFVCAAASAAQSAPAPQLQIDQAMIAAGRLLISGRTAKPDQVITLTNTGDRTASLPSRRFNFSLSYLPETCKVTLKVENEELNDILIANCAPRGKDGADGARGQDGLPATAGKDGLPGKDGKDGLPGRDGKDGLAGKDGLPGRDGKDGLAGKDGLPGKDGPPGKDGADGFTYGRLQGDSAAFKCWPSDMIGLWFIRDYPRPNSRTIARIVPYDAGSNKLQITEPSDPLQSEKPEGSGATQLAEYEQGQIHIISHGTQARTGVHGQMAPDCKSIIWKSSDNGALRTWER